MIDLQNLILANIKCLNFKINFIPIIFYCSYSLPVLQPQNTSRATKKREKVISLDFARAQ